MTSSGTFKTSPICVRDPHGLRGYWLDGANRASWSTYTSWTGGLVGWVA